MQATTEVEILLPPEGVKLNSHLTARVRAYSDRIREAEDNFDVLHENIVGLEKLIFAAEALDGAAALDALTELSIAERTYLNDAYSRWETEIEYQFARAIVDGRQTSIAHYYLAERFSNLVRNELGLLDTPPKRVLFIGSGPLPITAHHLNAISGVPVDCLDRNAAAVTMSQQAIDKLGLGDSIRIVTGNGESFNVADYDVILIALLAKSKRRILRNVLKKAAPGCRVLCRTSFGLRTLVYEPTYEDALLGFEIKSKQIARDDQTISTLLLEGTRHSAAEVKLRWLDCIDKAMSERLLHLMNRVLQRETTIGFPGPLDSTAGHAVLSHLDDDLRSGRRHVLIAEKGSNLVGQVILTPHPLPNCRHLIELSRGIIDPSFRGIGLSLSAFREIAMKCEAAGCETIYLDVRAGTIAAELWKSFGFVPFGCLPDYARVDGHSYRGLYMSQKVASLKQQVKRLSLAQEASASLKSGNSKPVSGLSAMSSFADYRTRRVGPLAPLQFSDWRLKVHGICADGATLKPLLIEAARDAACKVLPQPGLQPPQRYGLGFLIVHAGIDTDFIVVCWWGAENELFLRVLTSPPGQPERLRERSNRDGSVACIWDLAVIWFERGAWSKYVMRSDKPDIDGYLTATLDGEI
jgi:predicted GNAT family N-acyltransferase